MEITLDSDENPDDPAFHQYLNAPCTDKSVRLPGGRENSLKTLRADL